MRTLIDYKRYKYYQINNKNELSQNGKFTGKWRLVYLVEKKPFGNTGACLTPEEYKKLSDKEKYYKNGNNKHYIYDYDFGSYRMWGNMDRWAII